MSYKIKKYFFLPLMQIKTYVIKTKNLKKYVFICYVAVNNN